MFSNVHAVVLVSAFVIAAVMGAVMNKTHFCTMGGVSDWCEHGRHRPHARVGVCAMAVALAGALVLEATGTVNLDTEVFPPYRASGFAWLRYLTGGFLFGIGMDARERLRKRARWVRVGGGNAKSLVCSGDRRDRRLLDDVDAPLGEGRSIPG
jgi:hypothetical protein